MNGFIWLTVASTGKSVLVNLHRIACIVGEETCTNIYFGEDDSISVKETLGQISNKILED